MSDDLLVEKTIDAFIDRNRPEDSLLLLKAIAHESHGGLGYKIGLMNPAIDWNGYDVNQSRKVIKLDRAGIFTNNSAVDLAKILKDALDVEIFEMRRTLLYRISWGTGKVILGTVETAVGVVGIIVPEPGTTAAGIVVTALGVNTVGDGISQIFGANSGEGYNVLSEGSAWVGSNVAALAGGDPAKGAALGRVGFLVSSIAVGSWGSIRILHAPGTTIGATSHTFPGVGVGRVSAMFGPSYRTVQTTQKGALTVFNVANNEGKSILRIVYQAVDGQVARLYVNGTIKNIPNGRVIKHSSDWRVIAKGLAKLMYHGAKAGW